VSRRRHGCYRRRLADLAVAGCKTVINLLVRRFVCQAAGCQCKTFVEQVEGSPSGSRRTLPCGRFWSGSRWRWQGVPPPGSRLT
jgi:transposase